MSLTEEQVSEIARLGSPVLCVDTCILLDIIRDLTGDAMNASNANAAVSLLNAASAQRLVVLIAEQVSLELIKNRSSVETQASRSLDQFIKNAKRMHEVGQIFGAQGLLQASHLHGHVDRTQSILDGWINAAVLVPENPGVAARGSSRCRAARTPAKPGKNSLEDCVVIEAYLEAAGMLRKGGHTRPIIFASSNTRDFYDSTRRVPADLAQDLSAVGLEYQPNLGGAKHALGL
ncbi:PIN domain-containing protein [Pseudomonas oryzihabitans]|uniref:PIN domain-containing protein n=1 Tax=Pseudomonas oryzihabitans TaxID=47885 RepID=UPI003D02F136